MKDSFKLSGRKVLESSTIGPKASPFQLTLHARGLVDFQCSSRGSRSVIKTSHCCSGYGWTGVMNVALKRIHLCVPKPQPQLDRTRAMHAMAPKLPSGWAGERGRPSVAPVHAKVSRRWQRVSKEECGPPCPLSWSPPPPSALRVCGDGSEWARGRPTRDLKPALGK